MYTVKDIMDLIVLDCNTIYENGCSGCPFDRDETFSFVCSVIHSAWFDLLSSGEYH